MTNGAQHGCIMHTLRIYIYHVPITILNQSVISNAACAQLVRLRCRKHVEHAGRTVEVECHVMPQPATPDNIRKCSLLPSLIYSCNQQIGPLKQLCLCNFRWLITKLQVRGFVASFVTSVSNSLSENEISVLLVFLLL